MAKIETYDLPAQDLQGVVAAFERYLEALQLSRRVSEALEPVRVGTDEADLLSNLAHRAFLARQSACDEFEKYLIHLIDSRRTP